MLYIFGKLWKSYAITSLANNPTIFHIKEKKENKTKKFKAKSCLFVVVFSTVFVGIMSLKLLKKYEIISRKSIQGTS